MVSYMCVIAVTGHIFLTLVVCVVTRQLPVCSRFEPSFVLNHRTYDSAPTNFYINLAIFSRCLVHVVNYDGLDIAPPQMNLDPLVLSRVLAVKILDSAGFQTRITVPFEHGFLHNCDGSKMNFTDQEWWDAEFKRVYNVFKVKPWYCEVHVHLRPPSKARKHFFGKMEGNLYLRPLETASQLWKQIERNYYQSFGFETRWRFDILVAEKAYDARDLWITGLLRYKLVYETAVTSKWEIFQWVTVSNHIAETYFFCRYCNPCDPFTKLPVTNNLHSFERLIDFLRHMQLNSDKVIWKLREFGQQYTKGRFKLPRGSEKSIHSILLKKEYEFKFADYPDNTWYQRLLFYVVGNATYHLGNRVTGTMQSRYCHQIGKEACGCGGNSIDILIYPTMSARVALSMIPLHLPIKTDRMFFGACGHLTGKTPFRELVASYDSASWCTIFCFMVLGVPLVCLLMDSAFNKIRHMHEKCVLGSAIVSEYIDLMFTSFKNLLEQGFLDTTDERKFYHRIFATFVLLMTVILSNAYKGDNFTKIISPLPPVPFSTFEQLVENSFKVYSFPTKSPIMSISYVDMINKYRKCKHCFNRSGVHCFRPVDNMSGDSDYWLHSELANVLQAHIPSEIIKENKNSYNSNPACEKENRFALSKREQYIFNHSNMMPPGSGGKLLSVSLNSPFINCRELGKVAIIQKENLMIHHKRIYNSFRTEFKEGVSFSDEVLTSSINGFVWSGCVPAGVVSRADALKTSGLLEYHDRFFKNYYKSQGMLQDFPGGTDFHASNLRGSIKVVFVVLPVGFLPGLMCLSFESRKYLMFTIAAWSKRVVTTLIHRLNLM